MAPPLDGPGGSPSMVAYWTVAGAVVSPERVTKISTLPAPSTVLTRADSNCTVLAVGAAPHTFAAESRLRGFGAAESKSPALLSVSVQPLPFLRSAATTVAGAGAGAPPSAQLAAP